MKKLILFFAFILVFSFMVCGQDETNKDIVPSQTTNLLERKNPYIDWKNTYFTSAVKSIFWTTEIPYGISIAFENEGETEVKVNAYPKTLVIRDLLNYAVKFDSRYKWKETNGIVNVRPVNDYPIMDTRIAEFKIDTLFPKESTSLFPVTNELEKKIIETKEFQKYLKERNLVNSTPNADKHGFVFIGAIGKARQTKISIDLKNVTVREILNEMVRQKGFGWTYREFSVIEDGKLYNIYRLEI